VKSPAELAAAMTTIMDNDYSLPINRPLLLSTLARKQWQCVAEYPVQQPACPSCQGHDFEWEGGDMSYYSGEGDAAAAAAEIDIRDASELAQPELATIK